MWPVCLQKPQRGDARFLGAAKESCGRCWRPSTSSPRKGCFAAASSVDDFLRFEFGLPFTFTIFGFSTSTAKSEADANPGSVGESGRACTTGNSRLTSRRISRNFLNIHSVRSRVRPQSSQSGMTSSCSWRMSAVASVALQATERSSCTGIRRQRDGRNSSGSWNMFFRSSTRSRCAQMMPVYSKFKHEHPYPGFPTSLALTLRPPDSRL